jgi:hypothetical protein
MRHPRDLAALYGATGKTGFDSGSAMFCGTLPAPGGIRWADTFVIELEDPILGRTISHSYSCRALPVEG